MHSARARPAPGHAPAGPEGRGGAGPASEWAWPRRRDPPPLPLPTLRVPARGHASFSPGLGPASPAPSLPSSVTRGAARGAGTDVAAERRHLVCLGGERPRGAAGGSRLRAGLVRGQPDPLPGAEADAGGFTDTFPFLPFSPLARRRPSLPAPRPGVRRRGLGAEGSGRRALGERARPLLSIFPSLSGTRAAAGERRKPQPGRSGGLGERRAWPGRSPIRFPPPPPNPPLGLGGVCVGGGAGSFPSLLGGVGTGGSGGETAPAPQQLHKAWRRSLYRRN